MKPFLKAPNCVDFQKMDRYLDPDNCVHGLPICEVKA